MESPAPEPAPSASVQIATGKGSFFKDDRARRAFMFGVTHDGFKFWDRKAVTYDMIDGMKEISPEMREILKEYHDTWYTYGVDFPEFVALILLGIYWISTGGLEAAVRGIAGIAGVPL